MRGSVLLYSVPLCKEKRSQSHVFKYRGTGFYSMRKTGSPQKLSVTRVNEARWVRSFSGPCFSAKIVYNYGLWMGVCKHVLPAPCCYKGKRVNAAICVGSCSAASEAPVLAQKSLITTGSGWVCALCKHVLPAPCCGELVIQFTTCTTTCVRRQSSYL
jgi:hypothetical protein